MKLHQRDKRGHLSRWHWSMSLRGDELWQGVHFSANSELYSESCASSPQLSNFRKHDSWKEPCLSQVSTHSSPLPFDWLWTECYGCAANTRGHYIPQGKCTSSLGRSASVRDGTSPCSRIAWGQRSTPSMWHTAGLHGPLVEPLWNGRGEFLHHILSSPTLVQIRNYSTEVSGAKPVQNWYKLENSLSPAFSCVWTSWAVRLLTPGKLVFPPLLSLQDWGSRAFESSQLCQ